MISGITKYKDTANCLRTRLHHNTTFSYCYGKEIFFSRRLDWVSVGYLSRHLLSRRCFTGPTPL
ncbi:unnamed protein product [Periconia digitata]|uniref:Uncharacterized protein n=1 Tax=Periconia digitata TaxID=1303443 RepID=A0A9W4UB02_9PLEO|nr:unnamed protein product [Periconia digitata]